MKITLDVDEGSVGKSVGDVLSSLSPEQKLDLAKQTMLSFLKEPHDAERRVKEREVIEQIMREETGAYGIKDDMSARSHYKYRERMEKFRSSKEQMVDEIVKATVESYQKLVREMIENDPAILAMRAEVVKIVRESFPALVHDATVAWFASHMTEIMQGAQTAAFQSKVLETFGRDVTERLNSVSKRIGMA